MYNEIAKEGRWYTKMLSDFLKSLSGKKIIVFRLLLLVPTKIWLCLQEAIQADLLSTFAYMKTPAVFDNRLACCMQSRSEQQEDSFTKRRMNVEECWHYTEALSRWHDWILWSYELDVWEWNELHSTGTHVCIPLLLRYLIKIVNANTITLFVPTAQQL